MKVRGVQKTNTCPLKNANFASDGATESHYHIKRTGMSTLVGTEQGFEDPSSTIFELLPKYARPLHAAENSAVYG